MHAPLDFGAGSADLESGNTGAAVREGLRHRDQGSQPRRDRGRPPTLGRRRTPTSACQVGSGTVTAAGLSLLPVSLPVQFDLVAPPKAGDLAGLALVVLGSQLGTPGEITVRSGGNPAGVGLNIAFSAIPNTYFGLPIAVDELQSTFSGLRLPTSCPATAASVAVSADAYNDPAQRSASAPLQVTGCSGLAYSPAFHVTAVRDTAGHWGRDRARQRSAHQGTDAGTTACRLNLADRPCARLADAELQAVGRSERAQARLVHGTAALGIELPRAAGAPAAHVPRPHREGCESQVDRAHPRSARGHVVATRGRCHGDDPRSDADRKRRAEDQGPAPPRPAPAADAHRDRCGGHAHEGHADGSVTLGAKASSAYRWG